MSDKKPVEKVDTIKMHKEAGNLMDQGKFAEARDMFMQTAELYYKGQDYFNSATMYYKAGECSVSLKEYQKASEAFTKSAEISLNKGFDRYGLSALEQVRDCQKALGNTKEVEEITKKIDDLKKKQEADLGESSFSIFS